MKREKLSKDELTALLGEHCSVGKVASVTSLPYSTVYAWYKNYNIELLPSCMTIYEELRSAQISKLHRSVILGSILGDGSLIKQSKSKNARLQIGHCTKQLNYLKWKKELLNPFSTKIIEAEKPGPKIIQGKQSYSSGYFLCNTIAHPDITKYYYEWYVDGKKSVNTKIIEELDLLALAIWLSDDGSFSLRSECKTALRGSIATCSFTKKENTILIEALKKFFLGHIAIDSYNNTLALSGTKAINKLLDMVTYVLPECIHYKFVPQRLSAKPL